MDIITEVLKRVYQDVKDELLLTSFIGIVIALTVVLLVSVVLPTWVLGLSVLVGWGLIFKANYDDFVDWATDEPEQEEQEKVTVDEPTDVPEKVTVDKPEQK